MPLPDGSVHEDDIEKSQKNGVLVSPKKGNEPLNLSFSEKVLKLNNPEVELSDEGSSKCSDFSDSDSDSIKCTMKV